MGHLQRSPFKSEHAIIVEEACCTISLGFCLSVKFGLRCLKIFLGNEIIDILKLGLLSSKEYMNTLQTLMERVEIYWCPNGCQYFPKRKRNTADEFLGKPYIGFLW